MDTEKRAKQIRLYTCECINSIGSGHIGGCLSIADCLAVLYEKHMNVDPTNPQKAGRDRLALSKGHAGPALYATLCSFGYFPHETLLTLNRLGTTLPSHCNSRLTPGVDMTAGSLGQGFSGAVGLAVGSKLSGDNARIYSIVGDGECQEGQIWEAAMFAGAKKLDNLTVFIDNNHMQIDGYTDSIVSVENLEAKWSAFNFAVRRINGHDHKQIDQAIIWAKRVKGQPTAIIMDTVKGKGVSVYEEMGPNNHSANVTDADLELARKQLQ